MQIWKIKTDSPYYFNIKKDGECVILSLSLIILFNYKLIKSNNLI